MSRVIVVSVTVGTGLLLICMVLLLSLAIGAAVCVHNNEPNLSPDVFRPKSGTVGDIERSINELKYGPVNLDAAKEVKNGLFSRIRDNRQARICASVQRQACSTVSQIVSQTVLNDTGGPLSQCAIVGLGQHVIQQTDNELEFIRNIAFRIGPPLPRRWGVLQSPVAAGEITTAIVSGVAACKINVISDLKPNALADAVDSDFTELQISDSGTC